MIKPLPKELADLAEVIAGYAREEGLDFYDTIFELLDYEQISQVAAYGGFPQRYPHWQFGMEFEKLRKQQSYGLGKIYEMVINTDPCYAYLLNDNDLVDQKTVMAHVYGHCDFFKHNIWFSKTNRRMMDEMANHATRIRRYIERFGYDKVEKFIDLCLSIDSLIDPHSVFVRRDTEVRPARAKDEDRKEVPVTRFPAKRYMERFINPPKALESEREKAVARAEAQKGAIPAHPQRDVMLFLLQYAPLEDWQADILAMMREEAYYFAPQGQTKIMNEGWATYWHSTLMTRYILTAAEVVTYCDHHSGTVATSPGRLNPYKMGLELFRDIEYRWNTGRHGKAYNECEDMEARRHWDQGKKPHERVVGKNSPGRERIFEVRRIYNDVTFIDEFLTPEFVEKHKLYHYRYDPSTGRMVVVDRDYKKIKEQMLYMLTNHARPYTYVLDGNYANRGELYLGHQHNGLDLEIRSAMETLKNIQALWRRPVHLQATIDEDEILFSYDGHQAHQQHIGHDHRKPVHRTPADAGVRR